MAATDTKDTAPLRGKAWEMAKTDAQKAEDIAYTLNHALMCTTTDFIDPFVGAATQKWLGKRFSIGCGGHDHGDGGHSHCHGHSHAHNPASGHLGHWWVGELVGDFGSVPLTVAMQRHAPGVMHGLRKGLEVALGPVFKFSAKRSAVRQAKAVGKADDTQAIEQRAQEIYEHEVNHLPQALVWTASSVALNIGMQKATGNKAPLWHLAAGKAMGVAFSTSLVVGGRAAMPGTAKRWDEFTSEKLFLPATKKLGKFFGVDEKAVDDMASKDAALSGRNQDENSWAARIRDEQQQQANTPPKQHTTSR